MKYWWLEKYKNLEIVKLNDLYNDMLYFLVMPKNYKEIYNNIQNNDIDSMLEEDLLINLYVLVETRNIKDNRLSRIVDKLLLIPDTNLPISDYSFKEILEEIKNLNTNIPYQEKMDSNNIGACYNCGQIFYLDKVKAINKNGLVLCPYCNKYLIYFDNDYIPMNYSFLKLAKIFYGTSTLGCKFKNIQSILKKHITLTMTNSDDINNCINNKIENSKYYISLDEFNSKRLDSYLEAKVIKDYYDKLIRINNEMIDSAIIYVDLSRRVDELAFLILISVIDTLSKSFYLKKVKIICTDIKVYNLFNMFIKSLLKIK